MKITISNQLYMLQSTYPHIWTNSWLTIDLYNMIGYNCLLEKRIHPNPRQPPPTHPGQTPRRSRAWSAQETSWSDAWSRLTCTPNPPLAWSSSPPHSNRSQTPPEEVYGCSMIYPKITMSGVFLTCCLHQYTTRQIHAPISRSSIQILVFGY